MRTILRTALQLTLLIGLILTSCKKQEMVRKTKPHFEPPVPYEAAIAKANSILAQLTTDEKIEMLGGHNSFFVKGLEKFNIPRLYLSDATQGVHIREELSGQLKKSVSFPCPIALSSTWNPKLAKDYAKSIGEECRVGDIAVLLGPGMNIYRISQNGRDFEYFGEDPYLAARMIENYVVGMQSTGTITTLKHFVTNNTDYHRRNSNSVVDLRTLHEIYLPAFKAGVDAGAMAVMTSYNKVNGEYAAQSKFVVTDLLRNDLGFKWLVMSDWWSTWDPEKTMKSGLDLEMPGEGVPGWKNLEEMGDVYVRSNAKRLLEEGKIQESDIDRMARHIIATSIAMGLDKRPVKDTSFLDNYPKHEQVALQTAREAVVLLKNENNILPLASDNTNILLTGRFVEEIPGGGGSAAVKGFNQVTMLAAMQAEFGDKLKFKSEPSDEDIQNAGVVVLSIGTLDSEGWDSPFDFPDEVNQKVLKYAGLNKSVIVVVNSGAGRNMTAWNDKVAAIVYDWYPGQLGYTALAEVLSGKVNPSGKLPVTIEKKFEDSPGYGYIPQGESLYTGWTDDLNMKLPVYDIKYSEGVMVGYRWYENKNIEPLYHFGYGLSYTTFKYSDISAQRVGDINDFSVVVKFQLKNTGSVAGAEVAQLYVSDKECSVVRPAKELKAFDKVMLQPGETKTVELVLEKNDFAFWDVNTKDWKVEPGEFELLVGGASNKIELKQGISIN